MKFYSYETKFFQRFWKKGEFYFWDYPGMNFSKEKRLKELEQNNIIRQLDNKKFLINREEFLKQLNDLSQIKLTNF